MEWKTLDIELDEYSSDMIIMDDQIYFLERGSFLKLNLETMEIEELSPMKPAVWYYNEWIEKPSLLGERWKPRCATVNDKIFVCGGWELDEWLRTIEVFDLNSKTWTLLNTEIPFDSIYFRVAALDNFLMFCKRSLSKTKFWKLNVDSLEWTGLPSTIACTSRRELIRIEDKLVHFGKFENEKKEPICVDIFDGQRWMKGPSGNIGTLFSNNAVLRSQTLIDKLVSLVIEE